VKGLGNPFLVDSSFYIHLARQGRDPFQALALVAAESDLAVCGVVRAEVGRRIRLAKVRQRFRAFWDAMLNVPTDNRLWAAVEQLAWELDRRGTVLPLADLVIACCARRIGATVLTRDQHFRLIPGLRVLERLDA
jgi:predicted nucleic acid-binding protein